MPVFVLLTLLGLFVFTFVLCKGNNKEGKKNAVNAQKGNKTQPTTERISCANYKPKERKEEKEPLSSMMKAPSEWGALPPDPQVDKLVAELGINSKENGQGDKKDKKEKKESDDDKENDKKEGTKNGKGDEKKESKKKSKIGSKKDGEKDNKEKTNKDDDKKESKKDSKGKKENEEDNDNE